MPTKVSTNVRLRDGEAFVQGRSTARAAELVKLVEDSGVEGRVRATSHGYIVPEEALADYSGEYITGEDQPAVITEPNTSTDKRAVTNAYANREDSRDGVEAEADVEDEADDAGEEDASEFDPAAATVDEVNEYLEGADEAERTRVLAAEAAGKARKGITGEEK